MFTSSRVQQLAWQGSTSPAGSGGFKEGCPTWAGEDSPSEHGLKEFDRGTSCNFVHVRKIYKTCWKRRPFAKTHERQNKKHQKTSKNWPIRWTEDLTKGIPWALYALGLPPTVGVTITTGMQWSVHVSLHFACENATVPQYVPICSNQISWGCWSFSFGTSFCKQEWKCHFCFQLGYRERC